VGIFHNQEPVHTAGPARQWLVQGVKAIEEGKA